PHQDFSSPDASLLPPNWLPILPSSDPMESAPREKRYFPPAQTDCKALLVQEPCLYLRFSCSCRKIVIPYPILMISPESVRGNKDLRPPDKHYDKDAIRLLSGRLLPEEQQL